MEIMHCYNTGGGETMDVEVAVARGESQGQGDYGAWGGAYTQITLSNSHSSSLLEFSPSPKTSALLCARCTLCLPRCLAPQLPFQARALKCRLTRCLAPFTAVSLSPPCFIVVSAPFSTSLIILTLLSFTSSPFPYPTPFSIPYSSRYVVYSVW